MNNKNVMAKSLINDLLFKETLAHKDNREALMYFISSFTNFSMEYLKMVNMKVNYESILDKTKINDKGVRCDILVEFENVKIDIEAYSNFNNLSYRKSLVYVTRLLSTSMKKGEEDYNNLDRVIGINVINNVSKGAEREYNLKGSVIETLMHSNGKEVLRDNYIVNFFRIDKEIEDIYNKNERQKRWLKYIKAKDNKERREIAKGDEILMRLTRWIANYISNKETDEMFREWSLRARQEGWKDEGRREGIKESKHETAINMLNNNYSIPEISKITNLSSQEIYNIRKNL